MKTKGYTTAVLCAACGQCMASKMGPEGDRRPRLYCAKGGPSWPGRHACEMYEKEFLAPEFDLELVPVETPK